MITRCIMAGLFLLLAYRPATAEEIKLKHGFFTGYKYSVRGGEYHKVGFSGKDLRAAMDGNAEAQAHMDKYKSRQVGAMVTGIPGGFLVGWVIGGSLAGGESDSYSTMLIIGVPLSVASVVFGLSATSHLKEAVRVYNGVEESLMNNGTYALGRTNSPPRLELSLSIGI